MIYGYQPSGWSPRCSLTEVVLTQSPLPGFTVYARIAYPYACTLDYSCTSVVAHGFAWPHRHMVWNSRDRESYAAVDICMYMHMLIPPLCVEKNCPVSYQSLGELAAELQAGAGVWRAASNGNGSFQYGRLALRLLPPIDAQKETVREPSCSAAGCVALRVHPPSAYAGGVAHSEARLWQ